MITVKEIQVAIEALPIEEYRSLVRWVHERDWEDRDAALKYDAEAGRLDFLKNEAIAEERAGTLKEL